MPPPGHRMHPEQLGIHGYPGSGSSGAAQPASAGPPTCPCGLFAIGQCQECRGYRCQTHASLVDGLLVCDECSSPERVAARQRQQRELADRAEARWREAQAAQARREEREAQLPADWRDAVATFLAAPWRPATPITFGVLEPLRWRRGEIARARRGERGPNTHPAGEYVDTVRADRDPQFPRLEGHWYKVFRSEVWELPGTVTLTTHHEMSHGRDETPAYDSTNDYRVLLHASGHVLLATHATHQATHHGAVLRWVHVWRTLDRLDDLATEERVDERSRRSAYPLDGLRDHLTPATGAS